MDIDFNDHNTVKGLIKTYIYDPYRNAYHILRLLATMLILICVVAIFSGYVFISW